LGSWLNEGVTATLEQVQSDWVRLIELARHGEEVIITDRGRVIAKLTGVPEPRQPANRQGWLAKLARLRETTATAKSLQQLRKSWKNSAKNEVKWGIGTRQPW